MAPVSAVRSRAVSVDIARSTLASCSRASTQASGSVRASAAGESVPTKVSGHGSSSWVAKRSVALSSETAWLSSWPLCRQAALSASSAWLVIRQAAATAAVSVSAFVASAAGAAADDVLADRREFVLEPKRWEEFVRMLDRPARDLPKLRAAAKRSERLLSR